MKPKHKANKQEGRGTGKYQNNGQGIDFGILSHHSNTHGGRSHYHRHQGHKKGIKVLIVIFSDTNPKPRTVMIHPLDTSPTLAAMMSPWGSINVAGRA